MRRTVNRVSIRYGPVIGLLLTINLAVGFFRSRVTSATHVEVTRVPQYDRNRIQNILMEVENRPYRTVDGRRIETEVQREPSVKLANFEETFYGRASLRVTYRRPVAKIVNRPGLYLDSEGVIFSLPDVAPEDLSALMGIELADGGPPTTLTVVGCWQSQRLAKLATDCRIFGAPPDVSIEVDARNVVSLNIGQGIVVLGSCDDLDHKLEVLKDRIRMHPTELNDVEKLILIHPDAPATLPKNASKLMKTKDKRD